MCCVHNILPYQWAYQRAYGQQSIHCHSLPLTGELWMAKTPSGELLSIKKIRVELHKKHEANADGMTYLVDQDVEREAKVLKVLTADPETSQGIAKFIDYFESVRDYKLQFVTVYTHYVYALCYMSR